MSNNWLDIALLVAQGPMASSSQFMSGRLKSPPGHMWAPLSVGMRQRVAYSRCMYSSLSLSGGL